MSDGHSYFIYLSAESQVKLPHVWKEITKFKTPWPRNQDTPKWRLLDQVTALWQDSDRKDADSRAAGMWSLKLSHLQDKQSPQVYKVDQKPWA